MNQYEVKTTADLSKIIGISVRDLREILSGINNEYKLIKIRKKTGGYRELSIPSSRLAFCQKSIANILKEQIISDISKGYVYNESIKTNALQHINSDYMVCIDIKDYFPSFKVNNIFKYFETLGFNRLISYQISRLVSFKGGLPQGSPASPILSNVLFFEIDEKIKEYCESNNLCVTRYVDDITISSVGKIDTDCILNHIGDIFSRNGFIINEKKTRYYSIKNYLETTGIKIVDNDGQRKLLPRRSYYKHLKKELYFINKYGLKSHKEKLGIKDNYYLERIYGRIMYIRFIDLEKGNELLHLYNQIDWSR